MATSASFRVQMASIMEVLTKTALAEITKLVDDASAELRFEMCRSQRENEALKSKLLVTEGELRAARGCGEGTPGSSLNIAFEVKVCDEFRKAQNSKVCGDGSVAVQRVFEERLSTGPTKDEQYVGLPVEKEKTVQDALEIKYEPVDGEQDWSESVLLSEDWLEEDPKTSQSQLEQKISGEDACGTLRAAAANGGEGPLCEEEVEELHMQLCPAGDPEKGLLAEVKQEPDREPLTSGHPLLGSSVGLEDQCVWSKASDATRSGKVQEMPRHHGGGLEHRGAWSNDRFSHPHFKASRRLCSEKNEGPMSHLEQQQNGRPRRLPDGILPDMPFPLDSRGERVGSAPREESFEAESRRRIVGREEFVCTYCGKMFTDALELQTHKELHDTGRRFGCSDFGKRIPYKGYLKIHQLVHTREKPFVCAQSSKGVHAGEKCLLCNLCGKLFDGADSLKQHHLIHHGGKRFSCTPCGKGFTTKRSLKTHQSVHTGDKPHRCDECWKSFANLQVLKRHQRVHTGEKPHSCAECGKSFARLSNLKAHQIVHTGEKPHSCDECGKSFAHLCNLKTHQRVHTGEKPYGCMLCGKSFSQNQGLQKHILTHS